MYIKSHYNTSETVEAVCSKHKPTCQPINLQANHLLTPLYKYPPQNVICRSTTESDWISLECTVVNVPCLLSWAILLKTYILHVHAWYESCLPNSITLNIKIYQPTNQIMTASYPTLCEDIITNEDGFYHWPVWQHFTSLFTEHYCIDTWANKRNLLIFMLIKGWELLCFCIFTPQYTIIHRHFVAWPQLL